MTATLNQPPQRTFGRQALVIRRPARFMSEPMRLSFPQFAGGLFCVAFLFAIVQGVAVRHRFLLEPFASTEAVVTSTEPHNHGKLCYSYTVGDKHLAGVGSGAVDPGAKIKVFYLLSDSSICTAIDPSDGFTGVFGTALRGGLTFSFLGTSMAYCFGRFLFALRPQPPTA